MMFQLDMFAQVTEDQKPPTLHEMKQAGRAFVFQAKRGLLVWLPFKLGLRYGSYLEAESDEQALQAVDDFNHGRPLVDACDEEQQEEKGST